MAASNDEEIPLSLDRTSRKTRGKRMTKLLDEDLEEDELFWNQEALKEEEHDINYEEDGDAVDVFDSDFDEDEPEPDGEAENDGEERERKKKRLLPPGKPVVKKKHKKKILSKLGKSSKDEVPSPAQESSPPEHHDTQDDLEGETFISIHLGAEFLWISPVSDGGDDSAQQERVLIFPKLKKLEFVCKQDIKKRIQILS
ncbi:hypothetical protein ACHQM5_024177 [Ranunculus cassubicifolius]